MTELQPETTLEQAGEAIDRHIRAGGSLAEIVEIYAGALKQAGFVDEDA